MIRYYTPNALMRVSAEISKAHSHSREPHEIGQSRLVILLNKIAATSEDNLKLLASTLSINDKYSLAVYFPANRFDHSLRKLSLVLQYCLDDNTFKILFDGWQNYPRNKELLQVLAGYSGNTEDNNIVNSSCTSH